MADTKRIDWNKASELGLIEKINREVLHPLGLSMSRNPDNGKSEALLIADDGFWEYGPDTISGIKTDDEVRALLECVKNDLTVIDVTRLPAP